MFLIHFKFQFAGTFLACNWQNTKKKKHDADFTTTGLYHKLHGVHRPEAMKKSIIKRRKRVVAPANGNFASSPAATAPAPVQQGGGGLVGIDNAHTQQQQQQAPAQNTLTGM